MNFFVYIIRSVSYGKLYIGQTQDLEKRISDHNKGRSNYTKTYKPWYILAYKTFDTRSEAMAAERNLKNLKAHLYYFPLLLSRPMQYSPLLINELMKVPLVSE